MPLVATRIYQLSFFTGFFVSAAVYIITNKIFPVRQPTEEECAIVTVGRREWFGESASFECEDKKSYDADKTAVVQA